MLDFYISKLKGRACRTAFWKHIHVDIAQLVTLGPQHN